MSRIGDNFSVYRNEIKYSISRLDYEVLKKLLIEFCIIDPFMPNPDGYIIKSLYFDSIYDGDYWSKINGDQNRKKIRLRIYNNDPNYVKLEIKNSFDNYKFKESLVLSSKEADELIYGNYDLTNKNGSYIYQKAVSIMSKGLYYPNTIVQYEREAYVLPIDDIRVTFDKSIYASDSDELFKNDLPMIPVFCNDDIVLEVKYSHVLPQLLKRILSVCDCSPISISKYCSAREMLNNLR